MNPNELGAAAAARLIAAGKLTSETLVRSCLERISARDAEVRAWACCDAEFALRQARELDKAGAPFGPLHGLPIGYKDVIDTANLPTEYGSPIYRGNRPVWDAACVALARNAGAVILGKTATTEFANNHPAPTRNPRNLAHTPGGSSSGSAAAVADCMVPLAFGTQTGGSTIRPAAFCGIVGYKPSFNLVNRAGLKFVAESLDTIGLYARCVEDAALLAHAVTGLAQPEFAASRSAPRIGLHWTPHADRAEPSALSVVEDAARRLARAGARVSELALPDDFGRLYDEQLVIMNFEEARAFAYEYAQHRELLSDSLRARIEEGLATPRADYDAAMHHAASCRARLPGILGDIDVVLTLSAPGEAPAGLASTGNSLFNRLWTLLGVPSIHLPASSGPGELPLGVQLVGAPGSDTSTLNWSHWAEQALKVS